MSEVAHNDPNDALSQDEFNTRKRAYSSKFALAHKSAFRPHYQEGETLGQGQEIWRNVSEHCLVAGIFTDIIAEGLGLDPKTREQVVTAALIHDWDKKHESEKINILKDEGKLSPDALDELKHQGDSVLLQMGFEPEVISLTAENVPASVDGPNTLPAKILWYVDAMLSNTEPSPIRERFENLQSGWDGTAENPARAQRNIAFSDMYSERYGKSLYDFQVELGDKIGVELAQGMGYDGDADDLPLYLKKLFIDRVDAPAA